MSNRTDLELMNAWQRGDVTAGAALVDRYIETLMRFFSGMVVASEDASDLTQETLHAFAKNHQQFATRSSVKTYLFSIARKKLYGYYRKKAKRTPLNFEHVSVDEVLVDERARSPISEIARKQQERALVRCLRKLSIEKQLALVLYYWEGMSSTEISRVLDTASGTIKRRLQRAKQQLAELMRRRGATADEITATIEDLERWREAVLSSSDIEASES